MVYNQTETLFDKLILSLSFMVRSVPCIVDPYDNNNFLNMNDLFENIKDQ